jgi:hypothetical protein
VGSLVIADRTGSKQDIGVVALAPAAIAGLDATAARAEPPRDNPKQSVPRTTSGGQGILRSARTPDSRALPATEV